MGLTSSSSVTSSSKGSELLEVIICFSIFRKRREKKGKGSSGLFRIFIFLIVEITVFEYGFIWEYA